MKRLFFSILLLFCYAVPAHAQRPGKFTVGVAATSIRPADDDVRPTVGVGVTVARVPRPGWGMTGALNWFESDIEGAFIDIGDTIGRLEVRPLMGGVSYTIMQGRLATGFSMVAGPSFNRVWISDEVRDRLDVSDRNDVSIAVRPGVNLSYAVQPRVAITGFGGYLFNRPHFRFRTSAGEIRNAWKADAVVLSAGVAVALF
jgi:hypothetical protein